MNYHICVNSMQRPGSRSDCERCSGKRKADPMAQALARMAAHNAELIARVNELEAELKAMKEQVKS
jgi:hypothetical protein